MLPPSLKNIVDAQPHPLLFATVSGAHLYGFASSDSDYDLRGVHILPLDRVVGLTTGPETIEADGDRDGLELDLVTHDVHKFFTLLLRKNGYVLEQLYSQLIVHSTPGHEELKQIAKGCITKHHAHHYFGFSERQWQLFQKEQPHRIKPLLYVYRVLLTGIHLMRTGEIEANLTTLNEEHQFSHVRELIDRKTTEREDAPLVSDDMPFHEGEYARLRNELECAYQASTLSEEASAKPALHDLLLRLR